MRTERTNILIVCGPNASGKTRLGVALALKLGAEIISADSRQVFRGMDIGTGKDLDEYATPEGSVPYHLIDIAEPAQIYTLYHYQRDCYEAIRKVRARGKLAVMVGGTGLYIEAVLKHYNLPNVAEDPQLRNALMKEPKAELESRLRSLDNALYERTDRSSKKRIVRALEIGACGGDRSPSEGAEPPELVPLVLCIRWPRDKLVRRIDRRLEQRLGSGMIDEVRGLLASGIPRARFAMFGMEYKHVAAYIDGEVGYEEMVEKLRTDIHRLAKRQMTYFRGMERRGVAMHWVDEADLGRALSIVGEYSFAAGEGPAPA